eukprot:COSAG04_NODE_3744_length_2564_cov_1.880325_2_plen_634_part_01
MERICDWMRSLTEAKLEYGLFWSAAPEAETKPAKQEPAQLPQDIPAATSVELAAGAEGDGGGAVLCLITGEVFKPGPFEKPAKVTRQRLKKGPPPRIGSWRQGNSFAPLAALGGGGLPMPEGLLIAAGRQGKVRTRLPPNSTLSPITRLNLLDVVQVSRVPAGMRLERPKRSISISRPVGLRRGRRPKKRGNRHRYGKKPMGPAQLVKPANLVLKEDTDPDGPPLGLANRLKGGSDEEEDDDTLDILEDFAAEDTEAEVEPAAESAAQKRQAAEDAVSGESVFAALTGLLGGDDQSEDALRASEDALRASEDSETDDILAELEAALRRTSAEISEDSSSTTIVIPCPEGVSAGEAILVTTEDGQLLEVEVPEGVQAGDEFEIILPEPQPQPEPQPEPEPEPEVLQAAKGALLAKLEGAENYQVSRILCDAPGALKADKEVVLAAVAQNGSALKHASEALKADKEFVLAAVAQHRSALQHASEALKADKEFMLAAVAAYEPYEVCPTGGESISWGGGMLEHASHALKADKEFMLAAAAKSAWSLRHASEQLKADRDFMLTCAAKGGSGCWQFASCELSSEEELIAKIAGGGKADSHQGALPDEVFGILERAPDGHELRADREFMLACVAANANAL